MPHKIKQFTVLYSVADPDLQIRRGGGADHPDPEIGEGCTQFGLQIGGGVGVASLGMKLRKQANEMIFHFPSQTLFSFRRKNIIGNFTTIPTLLNTLPTNQ